MSLARTLGVLVALLVITSGVIGLIARWKSPRPKTTRQAVSASLRVAIGLYILVLVVFYR